MHVAEPLNVPAEEELNVTEPVGVGGGVIPEVSVTVAVHVVGWPVVTGDGEHWIVVLVGSGVAARTCCAPASAPASMASTSNPIRRARFTATYSGITSW
jgi:hypothetical protein